MPLTMAWPAGLPILLASCLWYIRQSCHQCLPVLQSVEAARECGMASVVVAGRNPLYELTAADLVVRQLDELSFVNLKQLFCMEDTVSSQVSNLGAHLHATHCLGGAFLARCPQLWRPGPFPARMQSGHTGSCTAWSGPQPDVVPILICFWSLLQPQLELEEEAEDQPTIATMLAERPF